MFSKQINEYLKKSHISKRKVMIPMQINNSLRKLIFSKKGGKLLNNCIIYILYVYIYIYTYICVYVYIHSTTYSGSSSGNRSGVATSQVGGALARPAWRTADRAGRGAAAAAAAAACCCMIIYMYIYIYITIYIFIQVLWGL